MFCDVAIIKLFIKHPQFYFNAIPLYSRFILAISLPILLLLVFYIFLYDILNNIDYAVINRTIGLIIFVIFIFLLNISSLFGLPKKMLPNPQLEDANKKYGILVTFVLGWLRWKEDKKTIINLNKNTYPIVRNTDKPIVIIIQCESFSDPKDLNIKYDSHKYINNIYRSKKLGEVGKLLVSGFGAYTMRTEYGLIFGHEEDVLGFCRFDPYLTALKVTKNSLPHRLSTVCSKRFFIHPHDLNFYDRATIMPAVGFNHLVGINDFRGASHSGRYISDQAIGEKIKALTKNAIQDNIGALIYAVTIENHGPWSGGIKDYLSHLKNGDTLFGDIRQFLEKENINALLVFLGDHRPSIPNKVIPRNERFTPFAICGFGQIKYNNDFSEIFMTPAQLHHFILEKLIYK
ncbi:capsule biosynthesis protein [Neokomagataea tanensis]|uniref:Capsule biosynthesis protein n=4 Tax=Neokomagataea TaxID=1223423 RepID=A0A4Y6V6Y6_9PROT|nr:capsule biosynthesis protein [Neokomagataea tanensis]